MRTLLRLGAAALMVAACSDSQPTAPGSAHEAADGTVLTAATTEVVMTNLDAPKGLAWGPPGALYVAESGEASINGPCVTVERGQNCYSGTGAVSRLWKGRQERVIEGLPSLFNPVIQDVVGPNDVSFHGGMHVTIGFGGDPRVIPDLGRYAEGIGSVIRVNGKTWKVEANISAYEAEHNPAGGPFDSNPYGGLATAGGGYVGDAGGNSLFEWNRNGSVSLVAVFPRVVLPPNSFPAPDVDAVPTEVEFGPDGALYVSQLTGIPTLPGLASIFRVVPGSEPTVYATGFTQVVDFDFADDGTMWVLQFGTQPFLSGPGALIRVDPDGTRTTVLSDLPAPTSVLAAPDGAIYVTILGPVPNAGQVLRVTP